MNLSLDFETIDVKNKETEKPVTNKIVIIKVTSKEKLYRVLKQTYIIIGWKRYMPKLCFEIILTPCQLLSL